MLLAVLSVTGCASTGTPSTTLDALTPFVTAEHYQGQHGDVWAMAPPVSYEEGGALKVRLCSVMGAPCFTVSLISTTGPFLGAHHSDYIDIRTHGDADLVPPELVDGVLAALETDLRANEGWTTPWRLFLGGVGHRLGALGGWLASRAPDMPSTPPDPPEEETASISVVWKIWIPLGWVLVATLLGLWLGRLVGLGRRRPSLEPMAPGALGRYATGPVIVGGVVAACVVGALLRIGLGVTAIPNWTFFTAEPMAPDVSHLYTYAGQYEALHPPMVQWLAWIPTQLFEGLGGLAAFRIVSVLSSLVALGFSVAAIKSLFRSRTALLLGAILMAVFTAEIDLVRYDEGYALSHAWVAVTLWAFARARLMGTRGALVASALAAGLLPWMAYPVAFVAPALVVMGLVCKGPRFSAKGWIPWLAVSGLMVAPLLPRVAVGYVAESYDGAFSEEMIEEIGVPLTSTFEEVREQTTPLCVMLAEVLFPLVSGSWGESQARMVSLVGFGLLLLLVALAVYYRRGPPFVRPLVLGVVALAGIYAVVSLLMPIRVITTTPWGLMVLFLLAAVPDSLPWRWLRSGALVVIVGFFLWAFVASDVLGGQLLN